MGSGKKKQFHPVGKQKMENPKNKDSRKTARYIGCCCFYCKTCRVFIDGKCGGCKLGSNCGEGDKNRAKCKIKLCCFEERKLETCVECPDYLSCKLIRDRFRGCQLDKCLESITFIKKKGYTKFINIADRWKGSSGNLE